MINIKTNGYEYSIEGEGLILPMPSTTENDIYISSPSIYEIIKDGVDIDVDSAEGKKVIAAIEKFLRKDEEFFLNKETHLFDDFPNINRVDLDKY